MRALLLGAVLGALILAGCLGPQAPGSPGSQPGTATQTVSIEGTWHGTYESARGTGTWTFTIEKVGENQYRGWLTTTGPYPGEGIPVTVSLQGNKITVGWAGGATFEGTVQGDTMAGTWRTPDGSDGGHWEGTRGGTPVGPSEEQEETQESEESGEETGTSTGEVQVPGGICQEAAALVSEVVPASLTLTYAQEASTGTNAGCYLLYSGDLSLDQAQQIFSTLKSKGFTDGGVVTTSEGFQVVAVNAEGKGVSITYGAEDHTVAVVYGMEIQ